MENAAPEAENAEEPAFGKRQSAESDGSSAEPNAEIGKHSDESEAPAKKRQSDRLRLFTTSILIQGAEKTYAA
ncbi:MAG: hypothetical protein LBU32_00755 [Clostridiales bacterium]|nr:hypothetical protein [Clostridiales bacterium]